MKNLPEEKYRLPSKKCMIKQCKICQHYKECFPEQKKKIKKKQEEKQHADNE